MPPSPPGRSAASAGSTTESALERAVLELLDRRSPASSICPSEVARAVGGEGWRDLMQPVRDAAARLADRGEVEVTARGNVVNVRTARGPVRLRRSRSPG